MAKELSDEQIDELLDRKEEFEDTAKELTYKIKELEKSISAQSKEVMKKFKTTNPAKLRVKRKKLVKELSEKISKLKENKLYQEMMSN